MTNNYLYNCIRCVTYGASNEVTMVGSYNSSAINTSGIVIINSSGLVVDNRHNGWTINKNGRILKNGWTTVTNSIATALSPYAINGNEGNKFKVDTSGGDCYFSFDLFALTGESVTLKITNATNNIIITTNTGTGNFEFSAVPQTVSPSLGDSYTISSDGIDLFII
jgi:hypothetical protein